MDHIRIRMDQVRITGNNQFTYIRHINNVYVGFSFCFYDWNSYPDNLISL